MVGALPSEEGVIQSTATGSVRLDHPVAFSHNIGDVVTQPGSQHIQVRECRISDALGSGIYMSYGTTEGQAPVHCSLVANNIDSVGLAGITALGKHLLVNSNVINASGNQSPHADLITSTITLPKTLSSPVTRCSTPGTTEYMAVGTVSTSLATP